MIDHMINELKTTSKSVESVSSLKDKFNKSLTLTSNGSNEVELLIEDVSLRQKLSNQLSNIESTFEVLPILNKMCSYSQDGYEKTLEIFDNYKSLKSERYKFKCITNALEHLTADKSNKNDSDNKKLMLEILTLINNLIYGSKKVHERIRIRYEFIGLKLNDLFKTISEDFAHDEKLIEQINLFNTLRNKDEYSFSTNDVDLNSHIDIFHAIYSQVLGTPHEYTFLCILRHLLRLDSSNKTSDLIWEVIEKLVCRATVFDRDESMLGGTLERYAEEKLKNLMRNDNNNSKNDDLKNNEGSSQHFLAPPPPPPPPPPLSFSTSSPNEARVKQNSSSPSKPNSSNPISNNPTSSAHSAGRNSITGNQIEFSSSSNENGVKLPQQCVPKPSIKMKPLVWSKIHTNRVVGKQNLWTRFKNEYEKNDLFEYSDEAASVESLNYFQEIEEYFKTCENSRAEVKYKEAETKLWNNSEKINLLDSKRSLNINIYLKQFRCSPDDIVNYLSNNENKELGLENLEGMLKILPDTNEIELLRGYQGEIDKLGEAEKFLFKLIQIPNYKLRIESLLLKEEFNSQMFYFNKSFDNIIKAADTVYNSFNLANMMLHICKTGNFINDGGYSGNAAGFKLSSLMKLSELKSNKHNITLLHVIIQQLEEMNSKLIDLPKELSILKDTTSIQLENLKNEVTLFCNRVKKLNDQIKNAEEFQSTSLDEFIDRAYNSINELEKREKELESWKNKLAEHFCEDPNCFRLEDCFNILHKFCEKMKAILQENAERRSSELKRSSRNLMNSSFHEATQPFHRTGSLTNRANRYSADNHWVKSATDKDQKKKLPKHSNENDSPLSSSSSSSLIKSSTNNSSTHLDAELNKNKQSPNEDNLDLDEYASCNESSFMRRANIRHSRKTALNRTSSNINAATNGANQSTNESNYLLNFLNNGLEQNRELTSNRHGIVIMSNIDFNQPKLSDERSKNEQKTEPNPEKSSAFDKTDDFSKPVTLRRAVSTSEADLAHKYSNRREIISAVLPEETNQSEEAESRSQSRSSNRLSGLKKLGSLYKQFEDDDDFMIHRSNKTKHADQKSTANEAGTSLAESNKPSNEARRRSSLYLPNNEPSSSLATNPSKYLTSLTKDEPVYTINRANLEAKRALFEAKKPAEVNQRNSLNLSSNDVNSSSNQDEPAPIVRNSKFRYSTYLPSETPPPVFKQTVSSHSNGIVSNCIMKFENNSPKTTSSTVSSSHNTSMSSESSQLAETTSNDESNANSSVSVSIGPLRNSHLSIKRVSSVRVTPMEFAGEADKLREAEQNKKVKSLSRNWELMASRAKNEPVSGAGGVKSSSSFSFSARPAKIVEKIEKFNSSQPGANLNSTFTISEIDCKKARTQSGGTNSDDFEMGSSKDDGFETQSNASSSQNGDTTIQIKTEKASCDLLPQKNNQIAESRVNSFNGFLVTITPPKLSANKSYLTGNNQEKTIENEPSESQKIGNNDTNSAKENAELIAQNAEKKSAKDNLNSEHTIYTTKNSRHLNAVVAIINRSSNKGMTRPLSSFTSSTTTLSNTNTSQCRKEKLSLSRTHSSLKNHSDNLNSGCLSSANCSSNMCLNGNAHSGMSQSQSICESTRRKSGSASALYLCDTASTKAKKAELKQQLKESAAKINKDVSSFDQYQQTANANLTVSYYSTSNQVMMNRRNSMTKKSVEKLNCHNQALASSSSASMSKESNGGVNIPIECSAKKQQPSVFDRLSRSSRRV